MLHLEPHKVMVCVGPGEECEAALDYAVSQALSRKCDIHLVMALPPVNKTITGFPVAAIRSINSS